MKNHFTPLGLNPRAKAYAESLREGFLASLKDERDRYRRTAEELKKELSACLDRIEALESIVGEE